MRQHLSGIDHVVVATSDLDAGARQFQDLGFKLMPRGVHSVGSVNHCIMFDGGDYFELFGVPPGANVASAFSRFLDHGPGLVSAVLSTDDAQAAQQELTDDGIQTGPLRNFSRHVELPQISGEARFQTLDMPAQLTPGLHVFCCQHYTRELVWTPGSGQHPNGVQAIDSVFLCSAEPQQTIAAYARLLDCPVTESQGIYQVRNKGAALCVGTVQSLNARFPGIADESTHPLPSGVGVCFTVKSQAGLKQVLRRNQVDFSELSSSLVKVDARWAQGASILFQQEPQAAV